MGRIEKMAPEKATGELQVTFAQMQKNMGKIPNIFQHMGNSPSVLKAFLQMVDSASHLTLSPQIQEKIALATSERNKCQYCLSAHTAMAKMAKLTDEQILAARKGSAENSKELAILKLAQQIVEKRGQLTAQEVEEAKKAGITSQELVEIIFLVNLTMFTNYFNHIVDPEIDFPKISL